MFKFIIRARCGTAFSGFIHRVWTGHLELAWPACVACLILTHHFDTIIQFEKSHLIRQSRGYSVPIPTLHDALIDIEQSGWMLRRDETARGHTGTARLSHCIVSNANGCGRHGLNVNTYNWASQNWVTCDLASWFSTKCAGGRLRGLRWPHGHRHWIHNG